MATHMHSHHVRGGERDPRFEAFGRTVLWGLAFLLVLVVLPLTTLAIAMLAAAALMLASIYADARHPRPAHRGAAPHRFARHIPSVAGAVIVLTVVASFIWPEVMVIVGVGAAVAACTAWIVYEWVTRAARTSESIRR